jgi:hypothetical protein
MTATKNRPIIGASLLRTILPKTKVARFFFKQSTKTGKYVYTKLPLKLSIGHKIYQIRMAVKLSKQPKTIPTFSITKPFKFYPNFDFWFKNKPSGNPA